MGLFKKLWDEIEDEVLEPAWKKVLRPPLKGAQWTLDQYYTRVNRPIAFHVKMAVERPEVLWSARAYHDELRKRGIWVNPEDNIFDIIGRAAEKPVAEAMEKDLSSLPFYARVPLEIVSDPITWATLGYGGIAKGFVQGGVRGGLAALGREAVAQTGVLLPYQIASAPYRGYRAGKAAEMYRLLDIHEGVKELNNLTGVTFETEDLLKQAIHDELNLGYRARRDQQTQQRVEQLWRELGEEVTAKAQRELIHGDVYNNVKFRWPLSRSTPSRIWESMSIAGALRTPYGEVAAAAKHDLNRTKGWLQRTITKTPLGPLWTFWDPSTRAAVGRDEMLGLKLERDRIISRTEDADVLLRHVMNREQQRVGLMADEVTGELLQPLRVKPGVDTAALKLKMGDRWGNPYLQDVMEHGPAVFDMTPEQQAFWVAAHKAYRSAANDLKNYLTSIPEFVEQMDNDPELRAWVERLGEPEPDGRMHWPRMIRFVAEEEHTASDFKPALLYRIAKKSGISAPFTELYVPKGFRRGTNLKTSLGARQAIEYQRTVEHVSEAQRAIYDVNIGDALYSARRQMAEIAADESILPALRQMGKTPNDIVGPHILSNIERNKHRRDVAGKAMNAIQSIWRSRAASGRTLRHIKNLRGNALKTDWTEMDEALGQLEPAIDAYNRTFNNLPPEVQRTARSSAATAEKLEEYVNKVAGQGRRAPGKTKLSQKAKMFQEVPTDVGVAALEQAYQENKRAWNLPRHTAEELANSRIFLSPDGKAGFVLSPEGDLQNVFNNSGVKGMGAAAVERAVAEGARTLDAYDGFLTSFFEKHGFRVTGRMKFNPEYAPPNMPPEEVAKAPDVVFMARDPERPTHGDLEWFTGREPGETGVTLTRSRAQAAAEAEQLGGSLYGARLKGAKTINARSPTWRKLAKQAAQETGATEGTAYWERLSQLAQEAGYDAVIHGDNLTVLNPRKVRLVDMGPYTDDWDMAKQASREIAEEAARPKRYKYEENLLRRAAANAKNAEYAAQAVEDFLQARRRLEEVNSQVRKTVEALFKQSKSDLAAAEQARTAATKSAHTMLGVRQLEIPGLTGRYYKENLAREIEKYFGYSKADGEAALRWVAAWQAPVHTILTGLDLSYLFLQGMATAVANPVGWARGFTIAVRSMASPDVYYDYIRTLARSAEPTTGKTYLELMSSAGVRLSGTELYQASEALTAMGVKGGKLNTVVSILDRLPWNRGFAAGRNVAAIEMYRASYNLESTLLGRALTDEENRALGRQVNLATGAVSNRELGVGPSQAALERTVVRLGAQWFRSQTGRLIQAFNVGQIDGRIARRLLSHQLAAMTALYVGVSELLGQEPHLDPTDRHFGQLRVGNTWLGFGGIYPSMMKTAAQTVDAIAKGDWERFQDIRNGKNPILNYWHGGAPIGGRLIADAIFDVAGDTRYGNTMDHPEDIIVPFSLQAVEEQIASPTSSWGEVGLSLLATGTGLNTQPITPVEHYQDVAQGVAERYNFKSWDDVPVALRTKLERDDPELAEAKRLRDEYFDKRGGPEKAAFKQREQNIAAIQDVMSSQWLMVQSGNMTKSEWRQNMATMWDRHASLMDALFSQLPEKERKEATTEQDRLAILYHSILPERFDADGDTILSEAEWDQWREARRQFWVYHPEAEKYRTYITLDYPTRIWSDPTMAAADRERRIAQETYDEFLQIPKYRGLSAQEAQFIDMVRSLKSRVGEELRFRLAQAGAPVDRIRIPSRVVWKTTFQIMRDSQVALPENAKTLLKLAVAMDKKEIRYQMWNPQRAKFLLDNRWLIDWYPSALRDAGLDDELAGRLGLLSEPLGEPVEDRLEDISQLGIGSSGLDRLSRQTRVGELMPYRSDRPGSLLLGVP